MEGLATISQQHYTLSCLNGPITRERRWVTLDEIKSVPSNFPYLTLDVIKDSACSEKTQMACSNLPDVLGFSVDMT